MRAQSARGIPLAPRLAAHAIAAASILMKTSRRRCMAASLLAAAIALGQPSPAAGDGGPGDEAPALLRLEVPFPVTGPIDIRGRERATRVYRALSPHAPQPVSDVAAEIVRSALAAATGTRVVVVRRSSAHDRLDCAAGRDEKTAGVSLVLVSHEAIASPVACTVNGLSAEPAALPAPQLVAPIAVMPLALLQSVRFAAPELARLSSSTPSTERIAIGSAGARSASRVAGELLRQTLGIETLAVGYNGGHAALNALVAGEVDLFFGALPLVQPYIQSQRLPAIGIASVGRFPLLPNLPTLTEVGFPGFVWEGWFALYAEDLDARGRARVGGRLAKALAAPTARTALLQRGLLPADSDPIRFTARVAGDRERAARLLAGAD
jgi:tripartite-type tricarboxylate transporter receptor subunit TctC